MVRLCAIRATLSLSPYSNTLCDRAQGRHRLGSGAWEFFFKSSHDFSSKFSLLKMPDFQLPLIICEEQIMVFEICLEKIKKPS